MVIKWPWIITWPLHTGQSPCPGIMVNHSSATITHDYCYHIFIVWRKTIFKCTQYSHSGFVIIYLYIPLFCVLTAVSFQYQYVALSIIFIRVTLQAHLSTLLFSIYYIQFPQQLSDQMLQNKHLNSQHWLILAWSSHTVICVWVTLISHYYYLTVFIEINHLSAKRNVNTDIYRCIYDIWSWHKSQNI